MTEDLIDAKIINSLKLEDSSVEKLSYDNPVDIFFNNQRYSIATFNIRKTGSIEHNQESRRIQIKDNYKDIFIKKSSEGICCIILGYDEETDTFTTWELYRNLYSDIKDWKSSKSLYTNINILKSASELGCSLTPINKQHIDDSAAITFKTQYLSNYLSSPKNKKIIFKDTEEEIISLDHLHDRNNCDDFKLGIQNLESGIFPNIKNKVDRSNNWILDEYIVVFELYLKVKSGETNNNQNNNEFKKTYDLLKLISSKNNSTVRTLDSISRRVANYKSKDPDWEGGLDGADKNPFVIFIVKKYLKNRELLKKDLLEIINKYSNEVNNNYKIYNREVDNTKNDISISSENLSDPLEVQNLIDRKKKIHEKIVYELAKKLEKKFTIYEDPRGFDLFAYNENNSYLIEVKTIDESNFISQTRSAIIQLNEYEFMNKNIYSHDIFNGKITKIIAFDRNPNNFDNLNKINNILKFISFLNIIVCYSDDNYKNLDNINL